MCTCLGFCVPLCFCIHMYLLVRIYFTSLGISIRLSVYTCMGARVPMSLYFYEDRYMGVSMEVHMIRVWIRMWSICLYVYR